MIEYSSGDMFQSGARALVCPVNTVGTMGKGLALTFKKKFPWCVEPYESACREGRFGIGEIVAAESPDMPNNYILHVATKKHWRDPSQVTYVRSAVFAITKWIRDMRRIKSIDDRPCPIAVPALGCGLGSLVFDDVKPIFEKHFLSLEEVVIVYLPK